MSLARPSRLSLVFPTLLAFTCSAAPPQQGGSLDEVDFADPFVLRDGEAFYAFGTGAHGKNIQVARSFDLTRWTTLDDALPSLPAWAVRAPGLTWAPSVLRRADRYVLYYTAPDAVSGFQCISRAVAPRPEGPYVDDSLAPFVCDDQLCGSIDPSPFVDESGRPHLLWKSDENAERCRGAARIWSQALSEDGLAVTGARAHLLTVDRPWELPLIEGPAMLLDHGQYYLFYSANWYESADYAIGYATCRGPLGPCEKVTVDSAVLRSSGSLLGPGGQEFFDDARGQRWMTYHAWSAPNATYAAGGARGLRFARVSFEGGAPSFTRSPR